MRRSILLIPLGLLISPPAFGDDGVQWNAQFRADEKAVHVVIDTRAMARNAYLEQIRCRFRVDGGNGEFEVPIPRRVEGGSLYREIVSVAFGGRALTPIKLLYQFVVLGGKADEIQESRSGEAPPRQNLGIDADRTTNTAREQMQTGEIQRITATYGENCGAAHDNATEALVRACNGKKVCEYKIDFRVIGDPVPGCAKDFFAEYFCPGAKGPKKILVPPEAGFGQVITLSCP